MIQRRNFIISLLLLLGQYSFSQVVKPDFNLLRGTSTFTLGKISSIAQDRYGYMWFADQTNGCLVRYDGYRMKIYRNDPGDSNSIGSKNFECLAADASGNIWIAVPHGVDKFDATANKFIHYRYPKDEIVGLANNVLVDHSGIVWLGTGNGLDKLDPSTGAFLHYGHQDNDSSSLSCNVVRSLYEDKAGVIWVGTGIAFDVSTKEGGLNRLNKEKGTFTRYLHDPNNPHSLASNKVRAIFEDSRGNFWVGTDGDGLHLMNRQNGTFERLSYDPAHPEKLSRPPVKKGQEYDHITFIGEDMSGKIWIGTYADGLMSYDPETKKIDHFDESDKKRPRGYTDNTTWGMYISKDGIIWISNEHSDLFRVDPLQTGFSEVREKETEDDFLEDSSGNLWMTVSDSGLVMVNSKTNKRKQFLHNPEDSFSISSNSGTFIRQRADGQVWVGSWNGGNLFNPKTGKFTRYFYNKNDKGSDDHDTTGVFALLETANDTYFGVYGGLTILNKATNTFTRFVNNPADTNSISAGGVVSILDKGDGNIWMSVWNGDGAALELFNPKTKKFRHYLKGLIIWNIFKGSDGKVWVGTSKGLYLRNDSLDSFSPVGEEGAEFRNARIKSMTEDGDKNIWGVSSIGIFRLNPYKNELTIYGEKFGTSDVGALAYQPCYTTSDGELLFANPHGYYTCLPRRVFNASQPQVILTDFKIDGHSLKAGVDGILKGSLEDVKKLTLSHSQNTFSIDFAGIHFADPENNIHQYKLEGYENAWRNTGPEKTAYYFNLSPRRYVFRIRVISSYGVIAEKSIEIIILPPWWQTWWAYTLYGVVLVLLVWSFIKWRTNVLNKEKITLEKKVAERTQELKNEKEIVESTLAELKSTQTQLIQSEKMASLGELAAGIAHEIQNPLNFVNNFSEVNSELLSEMKDEMNRGNLDEAKSIANDVIENQEKINHHGKRADAIVKGMLQHSRSSSGIKEPTDINALTDEYLRLAYHGLRAKDNTFNATMETEYDTTIGKINVIPQDVGRVILNLITNAFYAVTEKKKQVGAGYNPTVLVSTKRIYNKVEVRVKDNGNGIPQKILDKIFQPFFTTKPTGQGTGLGLSLSYDVIKAHGGEIKVNTREGEFTEFTIQLPI